MGSGRTPLTAGELSILVTISVEHNYDRIQNSNAIEQELPCWLVRIFLEYMYTVLYSRMHGWK